MKHLVFLLLIVSSVDSINVLRGLAGFGYAGFRGRIEDPVIGILTVPISDSIPKDILNKRPGLIGTTLSSYKKWVESTGARAVVIPHWADIIEIQKILKQVNGLLIPGGGKRLV